MVLDLQPLAGTANQNTAICEHDLNDVECADGALCSSPCPVAPAQKAE